ncbi:MAG: DUF1343 domain-containing protein [Deltaproteobacteria bacterium]|nr:DUF1343 domain-containing protein [Deltaproteobacteria bacterium]
MSEGRGTTQPFEVFGAPFIDTARMEASTSKVRLPGVHLRPIAFEPTSDKWAGRVCHGFQLHIVDPLAFKPYLTTLVLMQAVVGGHRDAFEWTPPPYEYEPEKLPFDVITGDPLVRQAIENQGPMEDLEQTWSDELNEFKEICRSLLLYA